MQGWRGRAGAKGKANEQEDGRGWEKGVIGDAETERGEARGDEEREGK